jgi:hypothetical protein
MQRKSGFGLSENVLILASDWLAASLHIKITPNTTTGPTNKEGIYMLVWEPLPFLEYFGQEIVNFCYFLNQLLLTQLPEKDHLIRIII